MKEWNYHSVMEYLEQVNQYVAGTGVWRGKMILEALNHPESNMKIIHVAGSNGKGSVCAYMESCLSECGYRVGLFTSPHLVDIRERIQMCGEMIDKDMFLEGFQKVYDTEEKIKETNPEFELAYFDYLLAIALLKFRENHMEYVILETGLGGRLDATNAVENPILSVITTISLEHTAILGNSIGQIAQEKSGIIKKGIPVVFCEDNAESTEVIKNQAKEYDSAWVPVSLKDYEIQKNTGKELAFSIYNEYYKNDCFLIATAALYQVMNASVALTALGVIAKGQETIFPIQKLQSGMKKAYWPGRMEEILPGIYVDGAHNPQGIDAFVKTVTEMCRNLNVTTAILLFAVVNDKDYEQMIQTIEQCPVFQTILVTQTGGKRQLSKNTIASEFAEKSDVKIIEFDQVGKAIEYGRACLQGLMFCTGSLYLAGDIKSYLQEK